MPLLRGVLAGREVIDHGHDPDGLSGVISQNGSMDAHPNDAAVFADATFLNGPRVGVAAEYPRKFTHVSSAILRMSKANEGLGQQFVL